MQDVTKYKVFFISDDIPARGAYYPDGGIPVVAGGRMERAYRRGRPLSPSTEMMVQEMAGDSDARRLGNYVVVRRVVRPRVRVDQSEEGAAMVGEDSEDGKYEIKCLQFFSCLNDTSLQDNRFLNYLSLGDSRII